jgi:hypothetical protein
VISRIQPSSMVPGIHSASMKCRLFSYVAGPPFRYRSPILTRCTATESCAKLKAKASSTVKHVSADHWV